MNPVVRSDILVSHFLDSVGGYRHKERRDRLLNILDVDLDWFASLEPLMRSSLLMSVAALLSIGACMPFLMENVDEFSSAWDS